MNLEVDAGRVVARYQQALADANHRTMMAEAMNDQLAAEIAELRKAATERNEHG